MTATTTAALDLFCICRSDLLVLDDRIPSHDRYILAPQNDPGLLKIIALLGMVLEMLPDGANSEVAQKQAVGNHQREDQEAYGIETLEHQNNRHEDEKHHEFVENCAGRTALAPPVACFEAADAVAVGVGVRLEHPPALLYPRMPSDRGCPSSGAARNRSLATELRRDSRE